MEIITRRKNINPLLEKCISGYTEAGLDNCVELLVSTVLSEKVKFPILEYCGLELYKQVSADEHFQFLKAVAQHRTIGGNVIIGIILQKRLEVDYESALEEAAMHIEYGAEWYVTDIIGERVFGKALLLNFHTALPFLRTLKKHPSKWVVRSIGAGIHYAVKKGLPKQESNVAFKLLLEMANATDYHVKLGIGWSAKTIARFHPDIIYEYSTIINDSAKTGRWFKSKVQIGLERHTYAQRNKR